MNIQSIKYLAALAKYCHFGKAAKACFVSQPTLSMQIKKLEDQLGVALLERNNKYVKLTDIGKELANHARCILKETELMREKALAAKDPYSGQLKLGIIPTVAPYLLPLVMPKLSERFPNLIYHLHEAKTDSLIAELKQGNLDAVFLALPINDPQLTARAFFTEDFLLAISACHPWSKHPKISSKQLTDQTVLLLEDGHCLRDQALDFCEHAGASEAQTYHTTSLETLRNMVALGIGITLMPKLACRQNDGLKYLAFSDAKPARSLGIIWRTTTGRTQLFNDLHIQLKMIMNPAE